MTRVSREAACRERWRRQAARLIAEAMGKGDCEWCQGRRVDGHGDCPACGGRFDVAAVRACCERIIAEAERRSIERVAFEDWTRGLGMGPENREPGAFGSLCPGCGSSRSTRSFASCPCGQRSGDQGSAPGDLPGGWPGPLAREWGTVPCKACEGRGREKPTRAATQAEVLCDRAHWAREIGEAEQAFARGEADGLPHVSVCGHARPKRCEVCKGKRVVPHPSARRTRSVAAGPGLARTAQRLLDTLDGRCPWAPSAPAQPTECRSCSSQVRQEPVFNADGKCSACHRAGTIPPIEFSPQLLRKLADMPESPGHGTEDDWINRLITRHGERLLDARDTPRMTARGPTGETRVMPRGLTSSPEAATITLRN